MVSAFILQMHSHLGEGLFFLVDRLEFIGLFALLT